MSEVVNAAPAAPVVAEATPAAPAQAMTSIPAASKTFDAAKPAQSEAKPAEEFLEYEVEGKKQRLSRADALKKLSLQDASYKRFEEAAAMRKEAESFLSNLKDPKSALKMLFDPRLGHDQKNIISAIEELYLDKVIKPSEMTPEQRELAELREWRKNKETEESELQKQRQEWEENQRTQVYSKQLEQELIQTLNESGLPKDKYHMSRIAYWMRVNAEKGINAPQHMVIDQVKHEVRTATQAATTGLDGQQLIDYLGEEVVKKLRNWDLSQIRARRSQSQEPTPIREESQKERAKISVEEYKKNKRAWI